MGVIYITSNYRKNTRFLSKTCEFIQSVIKLLENCRVIEKMSINRAFRAFSEYFDIFSLFFPFVRDKDFTIQRIVIEILKLFLRFRNVSFLQYFCEYLFTYGDILEKFFDIWLHESSTETDFYDYSKIISRDLQKNLNFSSYWILART